MESLTASVEAVYLIFMLQLLVIELHTVLYKLMYLLCKTILRN